MGSIVVTQIEESIMSLPADEQLRLISSVADALRKSAEYDSDFDAQIAEMANDPDVQRELKEIERDFRGTELDGLHDD